MASTGCQTGKQTPAESYDPNDYEHVVSKRPVADSMVRKTIAEYIVGKTKVDQFLKDADFELEKLLASKTHAITTKRGWLVELLSVGIEAPHGTTLEFRVFDKDVEIAKLEFKGDVLTAREIR